MIRPPLGTFLHSTPRFLGAATMMLLLLIVSPAPCAELENPMQPQRSIRTDRYGDPLPEGALARLGTIRFRQGFLVYRAIFSPDGKTIACAAAGRGLCLWDAATGKEVRRFGTASHANAVAFSPDGKLLISQDKGMPALFDVVSGKVLGPLANANGGVASVAFAPDGQSVAVAQYNGGFAVWDVKEPAKSRQRFAKGQSKTRCVAYSPDSKLLATGGEDKIIYLWDAATGEERGRLTGHEKEVHSLAFGAKGRFLFSASEEPSIRMWDMATRKSARVLEGKQNRARALAVSRDGKTLASGDIDGVIILWNAETGKQIRRWHESNMMVQTLDIAPDGVTLVSGAVWECGPRLWDMATGKEKRLRSGHHGPVDWLAYSSDGRSLLSSGRGKLMLRWDLASGQESIRFDRPVWAIDHFELSPTGNTAATWAYKDNVIRLWDVATNKERCQLGKFPDKSGRGRIFAPLVFSPDGRLLAFGDSNTHEVIVWDVASGKERRRYAGLQADIVCAAFSADGKRIAAGSLAAGVKKPSLAVWDVASGTSGARFVSIEAVENLVFAPDGHTLATSNWQGPTLLWDVETGRNLRPLSVPGQVYGLAFSRDGKWLAGAGADHDQKIHVWEVLTGQQVHCFQGHLVGAMSVAFAPDGRSLASGGADSTGLVWDLTGRQQKGSMQAAKWTPRELKQRWLDLGSTAGPQAVQAVWDLVASPEQTVPLVRQQIKPVEPADVQRVDQRIRDLDSEVFETRNKATEELMFLVDAAEPAMRKRLAEKPSLEMRQRLKQILDKLDPLTSGERLRALRAVQVLEYAGTPEAREHLRKLAKGIPEARLTREAKAALERLAAQNKS